MPLSFEIILASLRGIRELANLTTGAVAPTGGDSGQAQFQGRENASQTDANREKKIGDERPLLQMRIMHVIVDIDCIPSFIWKIPEQDEEKHDDRHDGMPEFGARRRINLFRQATGRSQ